MDPELQPDDEYTSPAAADEQEYTSHGGGMFAGSQNFVIAGGTFTNLTTNYVTAVTAPAAPTDLRMIPLGDIDLQQQLSVESGSGIIGRRRERRCIRRVYSANIDGRRSNVTVAMYQGDGAEEDWREDVKMYLAVRHPNIVQVWGGASRSNIHATVFHGDLVPFKQYMARHSPVVTVYLYACFSYELRCAMTYLGEVLQRRIVIWIRRSTGRLCMDLNHLIPPSDDLRKCIASLIASACPLIQDAEAIESLTIEDYHLICSKCLNLYRRIPIPPSETVSFGVVWHCRDDADAAIAASADWLGVVDKFKWQRNYRNLVEEEDGIEDRWTRYQADDVFDTEFSVLPTAWTMLKVSAWLSQAHHIFTCRQITSHLEDYFLVHYVTFILSISSPNTTPPPGYLFLCPSEAFKTGPLTFKWPDCPAYWSLDPSGIDRLSTEEATRLGFPSMELRTEVEGRSWNASVYAGLRQFHEAKGFDPDSQDVARHLGYPLYRVSGAMDLPFAHAGEGFVEEEVDVNAEESGAAPTLNDLTDERPTEQGEIFRDRSDHDNEDRAVRSLWFNFVMHTQLALIMFLLVSWMYDQVH
ncbi:hypothetical protein C8R46DRAFT_1092955 [Mycena filopes]|nr:hypothetical protein C8R46DRAFT_1092955 [Mycena filopes]